MRMMTFGPGLVEKVETLLNTPAESTQLSADKGADPDIIEQYMVGVAEKKWRAICPLLYQSTDTSRLPAPARGLLSWTYQPRGLCLVGESRTCKTRTAWQIIRRVMLDHAAKGAGQLAVTAYDGPGWPIEVAEKMGAPDQTAAWLNRLTKTDLLFIDDVFKSKLTEAQEFAFYAILERRAGSMKPTIVTMNGGAQQLAARMTAAGSQDRLAPIVERLKEFFQIVHCTPQKES